MYVFMHMNNDNYYNYYEFVSCFSQGCGNSIKVLCQNDSHTPCDLFIPDPDDVCRCYQYGKGYQTERSLTTHNQDM